MAYIGTLPNKGQNRKLDDISGSFNGSTTTFDLQVDSQNVYPGASTSLLISVGGVVQEPKGAFNLASNGRQITFTTAPDSGKDFFGVVLGAALAIGTPADDSVTSSKIVNRAVTQAKLAESSVGASKVRANVLSSGDIYTANIAGNAYVTRGFAVGYTDGRVPQANLDVKGNTYISGITTFGSTLRIEGGSPGADKVLTSDADGDATWATAGGVSAGDVLAFYSANTTGNVSLGRGLAVGYVGEKVPGANLDVNGNVYISGATSVAGALTLGTQLAVAQGGTGATSLTDGGVLLGSGASALTAMTALGDGELIVGDGATDPVAESGDTLRISIGVGTTASGTVMQIYSANTTGNARIARGLAVGYANSKVPGSNLDVKGNTVISSNLVASSVDVTNYLKVGDGAVAQPSIANLGDGNTGIWFPAADALAVSTGGSERARVLATGNVAIASTTDHATLGVTGDLYVSGGGRVPAPINAYTGTSQTLTIFDAGAVLDIENASAITLTVPPNSSVAFPVGTIVAAVQMGSGAITWTEGSGVSIRNRNGLVTQGQYAVSSVVKLATDEWAAAGDLTT